MSSHGAAEHLGIVELAEVCAHQRSHCLDLFEITGSWVTDESDPSLQRLFASACHRHAWHAELWAQRCPVIPGVDLDETTGAYRGERPQVVPAERVDRYRSELTGMIEALDRVAARFDPELDPGTARTLMLVRTDLTDVSTMTAPGAVVCDTVER